MLQPRTSLSGGSQRGLPAALTALLLLAACSGANPLLDASPSPSSESPSPSEEAPSPTPPAETVAAVPACDLLTPEEVRATMGFQEASAFDEDDVCKFVAVRDSTVVFRENVNVVSGVLEGRSLREFAEEFGERVGVSGEDGQPIRVEFGEEVPGLGDEALASTTEIRALAVRVGERAFVVGVTLAGRDFEAEVRALADLAVTRLPPS